MCAVSLVLQTFTSPSSPNYIPWTPISPSPDIASQLLHVIRRLDEIDKKLSLKDCAIERKAKVNYMRKLTRRAALGDGGSEG